MPTAGLFPLWPAERVLHSGNGLLVVDKPFGLVVHGGDAKVPSDVVRRLGAWLEARAEDPYLGVHQRLDTGTSGVLVFVRDRALNATFDAAKTEHAFERRYVAAVELGPRARLRDRGRLAHRLLIRDGQAEVVKSGGVEALTDYRVRERCGPRALVELFPKTGRTHQLRVQLAAEGAPIVGDRLYGGVPFFRLLLHAAHAHLPGLGEFSAPEPEEFGEWARGEALGLGAAARLERALCDAAFKRGPLLAETNVLRLVNALSDGLPGVTVDYYAGFATLSLSNDEADARAPEIARALVARGVAGVYAKFRKKADLRRVEPEDLAPPLPVAGEPAPEPLQVREGPVQLEVELGSGYSTGLFVDQRHNRAWLRENARGRAVLNLFSYTCSFSVAAALGGARRVVSVDISARVLERGAQNFRRNGLDPAGYEFVPVEAAKFLARAEKRSERFDVIILDPPSFATTGRGKTFKIDRDYAELAAQCCRLLSPGGQLLAVTNYQKFDARRFRGLLRDAAAGAGRAVAQFKDLASAPDCPDGPDGPLPSRAVLVTLCGP